LKAVNPRPANAISRAAISSTEPVIVHSSDAGPSIFTSTRYPRVMSWMSRPAVVAAAAIRSRIAGMASGGA
jgi:hypothetical protein